MAYEVVLGRSEADRQRLGTQASVFIGKHYVKMGAVTSLSSQIFLDVNTSHVVFVCGKRGCLTAGTKVFTSNGFRPIEEYSPLEDKVWSYNLKTKKFEWRNAALVKYPVSSAEQLVRVSLHDGQTLTMTQEHPLLVDQGEEFKWKQAKDMSEGDSVVAAHSLPEISKDEQSLQMARILGFTLADGNINVRHGRWMDGRGYFYNGTKKRVRIFNNNPLVLEQAQSDFSEEFEVHVSRYKRNDCNCEVVQVLQQKVADTLMQLGVESGDKAAIIRVPQVVWTHSNAFKAQFLKALFSCDGYVSNNRNGRRIMYYSNSRGMLEDLHLLLGHFDIQSRIRVKKTTCNGKSFLSHVLDITDFMSLHNWKENIGFFDEEKMRRLESFLFWQSPRRKKTRYWESGLYENKVTRVELVSGISEVYDLHVPGTNSFIANGVISHNTGKSYSMGAIAEGIVDLPKEFGKNLSVIMLDTMGVYWTMKYPNHKDDALLKEWELEAKGLDVKIFTPVGYFKQQKEKGIPVDFPFALKPSELSPEDWFLTFELPATDPIAVFIERLILTMKSERADYSIEDIVAAIRADVKEDPHIKQAAENRFLATEQWGIFSKEGTPLAALAQAGQATVLDMSVYAIMPNGWKIKCLVIGLISQKLFVQRMIARKEEEFQAIQSSIHYLEEEKEAEQMPLVWIVVDEAHEFLPFQGKTAASDALIALLREGRQPGVSLILATQQPGKIHTDVMTQSDILLAHRLTAKIDVDALGALLQSYMREGLDKALNILPHVAGAALALDDVNERMYPMRMRPRLTWHGGSAPTVIKPTKKIYEF